MLVESLETFPIGSKKSFKKSFCELKRPTPNSEPLYCTSKDRDGE